MIHTIRAFINVVHAISCLAVTHSIIQETIFAAGESVSMYQTLYASKTKFGYTYGELKWNLCVTLNLHMIVKDIRGIIFII